jgi:hypothetical protein
MDIIKCSKCKIDKKRISFRKDSAKKNGLRSVCIECDYTSQKTYRKQPHIMARDKAYNKARYPHKAEQALLRKYNLTKDEYNNLLEKQLNRCAICLLEISGRNIHTDHSHTTGKVRGLLCQKCNMGLGCYKDNVNLLQKAIEYLSNAA